MQYFIRYSSEVELRILDIAPTHYNCMFNISLKDNNHPNCLCLNCINWFWHLCIQSHLKKMYCPTTFNQPETLASPTPQVRA